MPAYIVSLPADSHGQLFEGKKNVVVFAEDVASAKEAAAMAWDSYGPNGVQGQWGPLFAAGTATEIVAGDLEDAVLRVQINDATTPIDYSVTGAAAATIDSICALMVTALNGDAAIAGAAYSGGNLLTCAAIGDSLGDNTLTVTLTQNGVNLSQFIGAIVDEGIAGAVLTVQMATDAIALPKVAASF